MPQNEWNLCVSLSGEEDDMNAYMIHPVDARSLAMTNKEANHDPAVELAISIYDALMASCSEPFTPFLLADTKPFNGRGSVFIEGHYDLYEAARRLLRSGVPIGNHS